MSPKFCTLAILNINILHIKFHNFWNSLSYIFIMHYPLIFVFNINYLHKSL